ncbi:MAG: hypothetical protein IJ493_11135 [Clostridia bacterium]|nr:hypothetical protein [Clostridia bacterium]
MKRWLCLLLILLMLPIVGCGEDDAPVRTKAENVYRVRELTLPEGFTPKSFRLTDGDFFVVGIGADSGILSAPLDENGTVGALSPYAGELWEDIEPSNVTLPEGVISNNVKIAVSSGSALWYHDAEGVWRYDGVGEPTLLLDCQNSGIVGWRVSRVAVAGEERMYMTYAETDGSELLFLLERLDESEIPAKYELRLAVQYIEEPLVSIAARFNRESADCHVVLCEYDDSCGDMQLSENSLQYALIHDDVPDMICLTDYSTRLTMLNSRMFTDLLPLMSDADRADILPGLLLTEPDGRLQELVTRFDIRTLITRAADRDSRWTVAEYAAYAAALADGRYMTQYISQADILEWLLYDSLDTLISEGLDGGRMREILTAARNSAAYEYTRSKEFDNRTDTDEMYADGSVIVRQVSLGSTEQLAILSGDYRFAELYPAGYPGEESGVLLSPGMSFGITKNCKIPEYAWDFLRAVLTDTSASERFSGSRAVLEAQMQEAQSMKYYRISGSSYALWYDDRTLDDVFGGNTPDGRLYRFDEDDAARLTSLVESAHCLPHRYETMLDIIREEASVYFAGVKTLDETVKLINDRCSTYLAETE